MAQFECPTCGFRGTFADNAVERRCPECGDVLQNLSVRRD